MSYYNHPQTTSCCYSTSSSGASAELKLYQAFIFSVPIFFTFILIFLFYLFYLRRRRVDWSSLRMRNSLHTNINDDISRAELGLKKELREMLPVIIYKESFSIKDTQCSVCLGDYQAEDKLQQIPACGHAFHMDCIDHWLVTHTTCPLCRLSLLAPTKASSELPNIQEETTQESSITENSYRTSDQQRSQDCDDPQASEHSESRNGVATTTQRNPKEQGRCFQCSEQERDGTSLCPLCRLSLLAHTKASSELPNIQEETTQESSITENSYRTSDQQRSQDCDDPQASEHSESRNGVATTTQRNPKEQGRCFQCSEQERDGTSLCPLCRLSLLAHTKASSGLPNIQEETSQESSVTENNDGASDLQRSQDCDDPQASEHSESRNGVATTTQRNPKEQGRCFQCSEQERDGTSLCPLCRLSRLAHTKASSGLPNIQEETSQESSVTENNDGASDLQRSQDCDDPQASEHSESRNGDATTTQSNPKEQGRCSQCSEQERDVGDARNETKEHEQCRGIPG